MTAPLYSIILNRVIKFSLIIDKYPILVKFIANIILLFILFFATSAGDLLDSVKSANNQPGNDRTSEANLEGSCNFLVFGKPRYSEIAHCLSEASLSNF